MIFFKPPDPKQLSAAFSSVPIDPFRFEECRCRFGFKDTRKLEPDRLGPSDALRVTPAVRLRGTDQLVPVDPETEEMVDSSEFRE